MSILHFTLYARTVGAQGWQDHRTAPYEVRHAGTLDVQSERPDLSAVLTRIAAQSRGTSDPEELFFFRSGEVTHLEGHGVWLYGRTGWARITGEEAARFPLVRSS